MNVTSNKALSVHISMTLAYVGIYGHIWRHFVRAYSCLLSLLMTLLEHLIPGWDRLSNFTIGVTNASPDSVAPSVSGPNYDVCTAKSGIHGSQITLTVTYMCTTVCGAPWPPQGRYVIVQLKGTDVLTLCEVMVMGKFVWATRLLHFDVFYKDATNDLFSMKLNYVHINSNVMTFCCLLGRICL